MKVLVVCVALAAAVSAQNLDLHQDEQTVHSDIQAARPRYRCRPPAVWESSFAECAPKFKVAVPYARLTYDGENKRTRTVEVVYNFNGTKTAYDVLYYQQCGTMFIYNVNKKSCKRIKTNYPWRPMSIPRDAKYLGDAYIGSSGVPNGGLLTQTWMGKNKDAKYPFNYVTTYTRHGCLPISFSAWGDKIGSMFANFYNVVAGIADPNVFIPPKACYEQGQVMAEDLEHINKPLRREHIRPSPDHQTREEPEDVMEQRYRIRGENEVL